MSTITSTVAPAPKLLSHLTVDSAIRGKLFDADFDMAIKIDVAAPHVPNGKGNLAVFAAVDGEKMIDEQKDATSPKEREAAGGLFSALAGSALIGRSVPFADGPVPSNNVRFAYSTEDGTKRMVVEPLDAPDHPGDAQLKAAFDNYTEVSGLGDMITFPDEV